MKNRTIDNVIVNLGTPIVASCKAFFNCFAKPSLKLVAGLTLHDTVNKAVDPSYSPGKYPLSGDLCSAFSRFSLLTIGLVALTDSPIGIAAAIVLCNTTGAAIGATRGAVNRYNQLKQSAL